MLVVHLANLDPFCAFIYIHVNVDSARKACIHIPFANFNEFLFSLFVKNLADVDNTITQ